MGPDGLLENPTLLADAASSFSARGDVPRIETVLLVFRYSLFYFKYHRRTGTIRAFEISGVTGAPVHDPTRGGYALVPLPGPQ